MWLGGKLFHLFKNHVPKKKKKKIWISLILILSLGFQPWKGKNHNPAFVPDKGEPGHVHKHAKHTLLVGGDDIIYISYLKLSTIP